MSPGALGRVGSVLASGEYIDGAELRKFESEFARACGADHCVGVGSGTDALTIMLRALGITGEVIVPALTFAATAEAVIHAGATPVFADVGERYTVTQETVDAATTDDTEAVIAVHLFGNPAPPILAPCVLEDAAQAAGAEGICRHPAAFSFYPSKNLACVGDGGAIVTDDFLLAETARTLRNHGRKDGEHVSAGYTSRLDEVQAAVLSDRLPDLERSTKRRREIAAAYDEALGERAMRRPPGSCFHLYVIEVDDRDRLRAKFSEAGIETGAYYTQPLHRQQAFARYSHGDLPVTERVAERMVCLPMGPELSDKQVEYVTQRLEELL